MTIVYRLEDSFCTGVYQTDAHNKIKYDSVRHPSPSQDSLLIHNMNNNLGNFDISPYHFGFVSIEQLRAWFYNDDCLKSMNNYDVALSIYETDEFYVGNTQLVFRLDSAKLLARKNLIEFFNLAV